MLINQISTLLAARLTVGFALLLGSAGVMAQPYAYIANSGNAINPGSVSVIHSVSNAVVATIPVGVYPTSVAVNPTGTRAYVGNCNTGTGGVSVINTATNTVLTTIATGTRSCQLAVSPDGTRLYVTRLTGTNNFIVVDVTNDINTVQSTASVGNTPEGIALNPSGTRAYITSVSGMTVIDTANSAVITTVPLGSTDPSKIAINPAGTFAYVTTDVNLAVINLTSYSVTTVTVGTTPRGVAVNAAGTRVYVANSVSGTVSTINAADNTVIATTIVGSSAQGLAINAAGTRVFVADAVSNTVTVIDTSTNLAMIAIPVGTNPQSFGLFMVGTAVSASGAPTIGTATAGNGSASVTFTAPGADGGTPITKYTAISSPGFLTGFATASPVTVSGLSNGTAYTFTVVASNAAGISAPSSTSNSVTPAAPALFTTTVTTTADGGAGSLRQALLDVQSNCAAPTKTINFNIAGAGPHVIQPTTALPPLNCANITIDGYSQPGASPNTLAVGNDAVLNINLHGASMGAAAAGLSVSGSNSVIRGLVISGFNGQAGIYVSGATNTGIYGNFIGTNVAGTATVGNGVGVLVGSETSATKIGSMAAEDRNVISGNITEAGGDGILVQAPFTEIVNNHIGTDKTGSTAVANGGSGIVLDGTDVTVQNNLIRFNGLHGIVAERDRATISDNTILGNGGMGVWVPGTECGPENVFIRRNNIGYQGSLGIELGDGFLPIGTRDVNGVPLPNGNCYHANGGRNGKAPGYPVINSITHEWNSMTSMPLRAEYPVALKGGLKGSLKGGLKGGLNYSTTINARLEYASVVGQPFAIDLFDNSSVALDTGNKGVGRTYISSHTTIPTDANGVVDFLMSSLGAVYHPTMTASPPTVGNNSGTSEFSVQKVSPLFYDSSFTDFYNDYSIAAGSSQTQYFRMINTSGSTLNVLPTTNSPAFVVTLSGGCNNLAPDAVCTINVTYSRATAGSDIAVLTLIQGDVTYKWNLAGEATAAIQQPAITFNSPTTVAAGATYGLGLRLFNYPGNSALSSVNVTANYPGFTNQAPAGGLPQANCTATLGSYVTGASTISASFGSLPVVASGSVSCSMVIANLTAPTTPGVYTMTIPAGGFSIGSMEYSNASAITFNVTVTGAGTIPAITSAAPPAGLVGVGYSFTATASGTTPITWSIAAGSLPPGLSLNSSNGTISGAPTTAGSYAFTLRATNAAGQANLGTSISIGIPVISVISVSLGTIDFGNQNVGATSPPISVRVTNSGNGPFEVRSVTGVGDFGFTSNCVGTIQPGGGCTIDITFSPLVAGPASGLISVNTTAQQGQSSVLLMGAGISVPRANMVINPGSINFGDQAVGSRSAPQILFISNTGQATLELRGLVMDGASFVLVVPAAVDNPRNHPACGGSLIPGASCALGVQFAPAVVGVNTARLTITHNGTLSGNQGTSSIVLSGIGTPRLEPLIRVGGGLTFSEQVLGTSSTAQNIAVSNVGTADLNVGGISVGGANSGDFTISANTCASLIPNAACNVAIRFTPTGAVGVKTASLVITSNATNVTAGTTSVGLSGTAIPVPAPVVRLSVTTIGFGTAIVGSVVASKVATITNIGNLPLNISGVSISGNYSQTHTCLAPLNPNQSCAVSVTFNPRIGRSDGLLTITSNATPATNTIALSGSGCPPPSASRFFVIRCG